MVRSLELQSSLTGMIHLPPLPGSPRFGGDMDRVIGRALSDAEKLSKAGVDALLVENFGDVPFPKDSSEPETIAALTAVAQQVFHNTDVPLGINVLRNDVLSALGIAFSVGAGFIRANVLAWARLTDQGVIEGEAAKLQRKRNQLRAEHIKVFADVAVKHSAPIADVPIVEEAHDVVDRALADAVIVTGSSTSSPVDSDQVQAIAGSVSVPVLIGSGVTVETAVLARQVSSGAIVGSALMRDGKPGGPIDLDRATELIKVWRNG